MKSEAQANQSLQSWAERENNTKQEWAKVLTAPKNSPRIQVNKVRKNGFFSRIFGG